MLRHSTEYAEKCISQLEDLTGLTPTVMKVFIWSIGPGHPSNTVSSYRF